MRNPTRRPEPSRRRSVDLDASTRASGGASASSRRSNSSTAAAGPRPRRTRPPCRCRRTRPARAPARAVHERTEPHALHHPAHTDALPYDGRRTLELTSSVPPPNLSVWALGWPVWEPSLPCTVATRKEAPGARTLAVRSNRAQGAAPTPTGGPVRAVIVRIGYFRQVVPDATPVLLGGADERHRARRHASSRSSTCPRSSSAGTAGRRPSFGLPRSVCRECEGHNVDLVTGDEFLVVALEIAEA